MANQKFSGTAEDVIGPIELEAGLYIVTYSYKANDNWTVFTLSFENTQDEEDSHRLDGGGTDLKKGKRHSGKQRVRLTGGNYVIAVEVNDAADWEIELQNVS